MSFRRWRTHVEFTAYEHNWDDRKAIVKAHNAIVERAADMAARYTPQLPPRNSTEPGPTLYEYLNGLQAVFIPDSNAATAEQMIESARQEPYELLEKWGNRLYHLFCDANPRMSAVDMDHYGRLIAKFHRGLLDAQLDNTVQAAQCQTLTQAIMVANNKRQAIITQARGAGREMELASRPGLAYTPPEDTTGINQLQGRTRSDQRQYRPSTSSGQGSRFNQTRYNGTPKRTTTPSRIIPKCWKCGRPGHT